MIPVLSVRLPWAWLLVNGPRPGVAWKDVENRSWATKYRGPVFIHASSTFTKGDWEAACLFISASIDDETRIKLGQATPQFDEMRKLSGQIIGIVEIADCVTKSGSPWFCGDYGFVMTNRIAFEASERIALKCPSPRLWTPNEKLVGRKTLGLLKGQIFHHFCDDGTTPLEA
jgi:hypothetical protein